MIMEELEEFIGGALWAVSAARKEAFAEAGALVREKARKEKGRASAGSLKAAESRNRLLMSLAKAVESMR